MGVVCDYYFTKLSNGEQSKIFIIEIFRAYSKSKRPDNYSCHCGADNRGFFTMARRTNRFYFICYVIVHHKKTNQMIYTVQVKVMPLKELLDPQGKAVMGGLQNLGLNNVSDVRIGKNITLQVEATNPEQAKQIAEEA